MGPVGRSRVRGCLNTCKGVLPGTARGELKHSCRELFQLFPENGRIKVAAWPVWINNSRIN